MPPQIGALLRSKRSTILQDWQQRVRRMTEAMHISRIELLDHMPPFLDAVIALFTEPVTAREAEEPARETAPAHGVQRLHVGFDVDEVIREYGLLAEVVLETIERDDATLAPAEQRRLFTALNAGAAEAVAAYVRRRDEELQRAQARHRAFVAHELRNPIATALAAHGLLSAQRADLAGLRSIQILGRSLAQVRELVDQVLTAGRLDAGVEPDPVEVDLPAIVREVDETLRPEAESRDVELALDLPTTLRLHADPRLLRSTVSNLMRNAVKYTRSGTTVATSLRRSDDGSLVLEVRDGCGGITASNWAEIFEPYARGADARARQRDGLGLGLAIAKQAIEAHGGSLSVRNIDGEGCAFEMRLPAAMVIP